MCDEKHRRGNRSHCKTHSGRVWANRQYERLRFDDGAAGGIFGVADPKLCFIHFSKLALNGCVRAHSCLCSCTKNEEGEK